MAWAHSQLGEAGLRDPRFLLPVSLSPLGSTFEAMSPASGLQTPPFQQKTSMSSRKVPLRPDYESQTP